MFATKRLTKELQKLSAPSGLPPGISIASADDFKEWFVDIRVMDEGNKIYHGQTFRLRFRFTPSYPIGRVTDPFQHSGKQVTTVRVETDAGRNRSPRSNFSRRLPATPAYPPPPTYLLQRDNLSRLARIRLVSSSKRGER